MAEYLIQWSVMLYAVDAIAAARAARGIQVDPTSTATIFSVQRADDQDDKVMIDTALGCEVDA